MEIHLSDIFQLYLHRIFVFLIGGKDKENIEKKNNKKTDRGNTLKNRRERKTKNAEQVIQ